MATYKDRVTKNFFVDNFASGANDWYLGRIVVPIKQIQDKLYTGGHDSDVYAYYSGVLHAEALQTNFSRLSANCWQKVDSPSVTQGIYDAMRDLQKGKERGENDAYISQGIIKFCTADFSDAFTDFFCSVKHTVFLLLDRDDHSPVSYTHLFPQKDPYWSEQALHVRS